ncbi:universal stress protein [Bacillus sp. 2205SS5-2]|uniref:universal stress protein n=1 Tax=Bacillus sp. 2205SS5-2 TaxID=3109031 RepID=UPI0030074BA9
MHESLRSSHLFHQKDPTTKITLAHVVSHSVDKSRSSIETIDTDGNPSRPPSGIGSLDASNLPKTYDLKKQNTHILFDDSVDSAFSKSKELLEIKNVSSQFEILTGSITESLCEYSIENSIDLIIIGNSSKKGVKNWLLGYVSEKIAHESPVPVLIV